MKAYDPKKIEKSWQDIWNKKKAYKSLNISKKKKYYVLDMFPYPSGVGLHVGHPKGYIGSDVFARMKRMQGYNVLHPMGYDAFGLPAEQYAVEHNINPRQAVEKNVKTFERQLSLIGLSYDWDRRVNTTDPDFYKFTQWIFLKIYDSWYDKTKDKAQPIATLVKIFEKSGNAKVHAASDAHVEIFTAKEWKAKTPKEQQDMLMKYRLAYEGYAEVNWCAELGTVLANDEVVDGPSGPVSERGGYPVVKKNMRQWFMRITAYADRLLSGLDGLNWSAHIKEIQKNWIGRSEGAEISFKIKGGKSEKEIKVFTTRPDTIFGITFLALAPEIAATLAGKDFGIKTDIDRDNKEKIGVDTGLKAVNPANGESIPVFAVNYVSAEYGTGAIMGVPEHDIRDFEFAKKYNLPIKQVVEPKFVQNEGDAAYRKDEEPVKRECVCVVVRNPKDNKYLCVSWKKFKMYGLVTGGIENGEDIIETAKREVHEETGYKNIKLVKNPKFALNTFFYHRVKKVNRWARFQYLFFDLVNEEHDPISEEDVDLHDVLWISKDEIKTFFTVAEGDFVRNFIDNPDYIHTGEGILNNSGKFSGMESEKAKSEIVKFVNGKTITNYKMRDAIFARQRYWGEPIPLMHSKDGLIKELPEKKLPLKLPPVKSYQPLGTGESPLASVKDWMKHGYETNTMPGWAGSSWYFLRYMDPKNKKVFASPTAIKYWKNVDMYVGGQEHATGHLLYSRFWHKFLKDYGLVVTEEPFQTLRNQGMILGTDNRKMSKRWGNVINPDDVIKTFGADTLRVYEMFMGPFDASLPWSTDNIVGSRRFLERVWKLAERVQAEQNENSRHFTRQNPTGSDTSENFHSASLEKVLHKTIQKVTDDIENFAFNTCVSSMMILLNAMEKAQGQTLNLQKGLSLKQFELFLKILSPFAPHITEEIWSLLGHQTLLVLEAWPKADKNKMKDEEVKIIVQVNGKVRGQFLAPADTNEAEALRMAEDLPEVKKWIDGKEKRIVFIPRKIINIVI